MAPSNHPRLRLTPGGLARPEEWTVPFKYDLTERGGKGFIGGDAYVVGPIGVPTVLLPLELLPTVAEVDLESDEAILGLVRTFGPLRAWPDRFRLMRTARFSTPPRVRLRPLWKAREQHAMWGYDREGEFVDEFRVAAGGIQVLLASILELESARFIPARLARGWSPFSPWPAPETRDETWGYLVDAINEGLRSSPFTLWYIRDGQPTDGWEVGFHAGPPFVLHPAVPETLYGVCILELVDHVLAADRPYRICANEMCPGPRLFSVQEGRSRYGGHRTDKLKYHTPACKAAQESREYRRRQADKKRGAK